MPARTLDTDDLRACSAHLIPVNRCLMCAPLYLKYLGNLAWQAHCKAEVKKGTAKRIYPVMRGE